MKNKKGFIGFDFLTSAIIGVFGLALTVVIVLVGLTQLSSSQSNTGIQSNITQFIAGVGSIPPYMTLVITIVIFVFIIGLVNSVLSRSD